MKDYKKINVIDYHNLSSKEGKYKIIEYFENGNILYERYLINNQYHREDGPTFIWYDENGNISCKEYCLCNKIFSKKEYYSPKFKAILDIAKDMDVCESKVNFIKLSLSKELNE